VLPPATVVISFALLAGLLTITPGLDTALILRTASAAGRRRATGVVLGIQTGTLMWGVLAATGVSAVLLASRIAYDTLRILGACYLLYLGGRMLIAAVRGVDRPADPKPSSQKRMWAGWRQGLLTNLLNPKMGAFYVALLPQFIPAEAPHLLWGATLAGVHVALGSAWSMLLVLLGRGISGLVSRRGVARVLDGVTGTVLVGFGLRIAADS